MIADALIQNQAEKVLFGLKKTRKFIKRSVKISSIYDKQSEIDDFLNNIKLPIIVDPDVQKHKSTFICIYI